MAITIIYVSPKSEPFGLPVSGVLTAVRTPLTNYNQSKHFTQKAKDIQLKSLTILFITLQSACNSFTKAL